MIVFTYLDDTWCMVLGKHPWPVCLDNNNTDISYHFWVRYSYFIAKTDNTIDNEIDMNRVGYVTL